MGNGGRLILALALGALALALTIFLAAWFDPVAAAGRAANAPWQMWAGRILWAGLAAGAAAGLIGGGLWLLGRGLGQVVKAFTVGPEHGLFPMLLFLGKHAWEPRNPDQARIVSALAWNLDRLNAGSVKAALAPRPGEELLPAAEPALALPGRALIYAAPASDQLALPVGVGVGGEHIALPLRDFGSGIVAGLPGLGKSEALAAMIAGLLQQDASGRLVKLAVADLKGGVDFGRIPDDLPALAWPVAKDEATGLQLMRDLWAEVQRRQALLDAAGVNRIEAYNARAATPAPYLLAFLDEIMMLTMAAGERGLSREERAASAEFNALATRVVSVGRALGVGVLAATQRPSAEVIPTRLRDLCGMRLAFRCATDDASRAILGVGGAELLPREPGRALLVYADARPREIRTYLADLEGGRFDRCMATARTGRLAEPHGAAPEPVIEAHPVAEHGGVRTYAAASPAPAPGVATPAMTYPADPKTVAEFTDAQRVGLYRLYLKLGSLSAVEWHVWKQKGGVKFYLVRELVNDELLRRGRRGLTAED